MAVVGSPIDKTLCESDFAGGHGEGREGELVGKMNRVKWVGAALVSAAIGLWISGCASYPVSKDVRQQAKQVTFSQVRADPDGTRGTVVIWGGRIINVANETKGSSVYVICFPLKSDGKPDSKGPSPGRFIATTPDFLDPQMLPQGQRITVAGSLNGVSTQQLGTMAYAYPVIALKELHVWPPKSGEDYPDYPNYPYYGYYGPDWNWSLGWGWGPGWGWYNGFYYPFYYGGYYRGYHGGYHGGYHDGGGYHQSGGEFHGGGGWGGGGGGFHGGGGFGGGGGGHGR